MSALGVLILIAVIALVVFGRRRERRRGYAPLTGNVRVENYIGDAALHRGIAWYAGQGWEVQQVIPMLINRGAAKWLIGFLARQRVQYTVTFKKGGTA